MKDSWDNYEYFISVPYFYIFTQNHSLSLCWSLCLPLNQLHCFPIFVLSYLILCDFLTSVFYVSKCVFTCFVAFKVALLSNNGFIFSFPFLPEFYQLIFPFFFFFTVSAVFLFPSVSIFHMSVVPSEVMVLVSSAEHVIFWDKLLFW